MKKVFITKKIQEKGLQRLRNAGIEPIVWTEQRNPDREEMIAACAACQALISVGANQLDEDFLNAVKHLEIIAIHGVGYDHVDIAAATRAGIRVSNTPDVLNDATADTAFLLMQSVARDSFHMYRRIIDGAWGFSDATDNLGVDLYGKILGVFGLGNIGTVMAKRCIAAFGMKVIYHNRKQNLQAEKDTKANYVSFETLLAESDVLSVHASLSPSTENKFNYDAFRQMKSSAIFINTARGKLHHEADLVRALEQGEIWGAGLDVTNPEPMKPDNPLLRMPRVCVLPHIGSATVATRDAMADLAARNVVAALNGEAIPTILNPETSTNKK